MTPTSGLTTTEAGGTATFTVVLNSQPTADVTIALSSSNTTEGTVARRAWSLRRSNWHTPQTVTVTGVDDPRSTAPITYTIVTAAATSTDPNYTGRRCGRRHGEQHRQRRRGDHGDADAGLTTTEAGGTATFTVVLNTQPTADVTIALTSSDTTEGTVSPASLTFTTANWNTAQTVTVTGVDDPQVDGAVTYTIVTAAAASARPNYNGRRCGRRHGEQHRRRPAGITVDADAGLTTTEAGGTATFTVVLNTQPTADVTIALTSSNTTEGTVSPASLVFTTRELERGADGDGDRRGRRGGRRAVTLHDRDGAGGEHRPELHTARCGRRRW